MCCKLMNDLLFGNVGVYHANAIDFHSSSRPDTEKINRYLDLMKWRNDSSYNVNYL